MIKDAIKFYYTATKLKDVLREGAVQWKVDKLRIESIAEHTWGTLILAISLYDELQLKLDLFKVLKMLTIHELEEIAIGDLTPLSQVKKDLKKVEAHNAVVNYVKNLACGKELIDITDEFNDNNTEEAHFAKAVDKLDCVLEFKKYQDKNQISLKNITNEMLKNKILKAYVGSGKYDLSDIFFLYHLPSYEKFGIDENYWFSVLKKLPIE